MLTDRPASGSRRLEAERGGCRYSTSTRGVHDHFAIGASFFGVEDVARTGRVRAGFRRAAAFAVRSIAAAQIEHVAENAPGVRSCPSCSRLQCGHFMPASYPAPHAPATRCGGGGHRRTRVGGEPWASAALYSTPPSPRGEWGFGRSTDAEPIGPSGAWTHPPGSAPSEHGSVLAGSSGQRNCAKRGRERPHCLCDRSLCAAGAPPGGRLCRVGHKTAVLRLCPSPAQPSVGPIWGTAHPRRSGRRYSAAAAASGCHRDL